eukprot:TRINITY_DN12556_c0_g2_i1.p1 TRINITY_DN12556_c0_g2~~TRINITY_DN12556_c0_g2_i1.p1  ORF type:complete len:111 (+),score=35.93 TRINITY_DN12556_c0_g2_i1:49-333(+)
MASSGNAFKFEDARAILQEEKRLQEELRKVEEEIYALETSYLENTSNGNLVRGWGDVLSPRSSSRKKQKEIQKEDRIFSLSSATAMMVRVVIPE